MATLIPYLQVEDLTKSVGSKILFSNISFGVNKGDRIALVARNGIGKSTLLDILMNRTDYDRGKITWRNDLKVHYLPQKSSFLSEDKTLSGGQRKWKEIEEVLSGEPDMLILDEPTNQLDLDHVVRLEDTLKKTNCTLLMVTHDRYFLDNVCNHIIEIDQNSLYNNSGNYTAYLEAREQRIEAMNAETERARNLYRTELDWMRRMPQARAHKAQYRIDSFYELEKKAKRTIREEDVRLEVKSGYIGNKIFEAKAVCKTFAGGTELHPDSLTILHDFSYVFSRYEKLGIIGHNGTGKSTFLKLLLGEIQPDSGCFDIGTTIRFGYYAQTGQDFDPQKKVIDIVRDIAETIELGDGDRLTASQFLQMFLFSPEQQYDFAAKLSGGERQRLRLCTVLMRNPNFLILDEPTNDLDIPTLQVLEDYLCGFKGCVIVVSHDRYFMDRVVDHIFVFKGNGVIRDFPGNYTQYRETALREEREETAKQPVRPVVATKAKPVTDVPAKKRLSFKEKRELEELEALIPQLEQQKQELEQMLSGGLTNPDEISAASEKYKTVGEQLDAAELRWLELND